MKIHGMCIVKDESDVVTQCLTAAARWCDHIYVFDNGTGVLLDASERRSEIVAGQQLLPQARFGGVRSGIARHRGWAALWAVVFGLH